MLAVISQRAGRKVGWVNDKIHAAEGRGLRDITSGDNRLPGAKTWFTAGEGWDACTGWGSPDGANIEVALAG